jgi:hypothetical protein
MGGISGKKVWRRYAIAIQKNQNIAAGPAAAFIENKRTPVVVVLVPAVLDQCWISNPLLFEPASDITSGV